MPARARLAAIAAHARPSPTPAAPPHSPAPPRPLDWGRLAREPPVLLRGDGTTAYRDPTAIYHAGVFRLFFTLVQTEPDGRCFSYTATSQSAPPPLRHFPTPQKRG